MLFLFGAVGQGLIPCPKVRRRPSGWFSPPSHRWRRPCSPRNRAPSPRRAGAGGLHLESRPNLLLDGFVSARYARSHAVSAVHQKANGTVVHLNPMPGIGVIHEAAEGQGHDAMAVGVLNVNGLRSLSTNTRFHGPNSAASRKAPST